MTDMDNAANVIAELAKEANSVQHIEGTKWLVHRPNGEPTILDERDYGKHHEAGPVRTNRHLQFRTVDSFIAYLERHANDNTELHILGPEHLAAVRAIIDAPGALSTAWEEHTIALTPEHTWEWERWAGLLAATFSQGVLAQHVEQLIHTIAEPNGAELLEMAQQLEGSVNATFKTGARLENGARTLVYEESVEVSGSIDIPSELVIFVPVYEQQDPTQIRCRVTYRVSDGEVTFRLTPTIPVDRIIREATRRLVDTITNGLDLLTID